MAKCNFCGEQIEKGTGKIFAKNDGSVFNFCSNKCEKNQLKLKRLPRETRWSKNYLKTKDAQKKKKK